MAKTDENTTNPPTPQALHTLSTIKLLILKKGEYDIWVMKMEHYLEHTDYPIWEVIQKGNGPIQVSIDTHGQIRVLPPKTAEEILARERERKVRTTLLMAISEDHLAKFHKMTDAKEMREVIKSRFGGNDESKKMRNYILKQQFESFYVSNSEGLHKGYDRFQSLLSQLETHGAGVSTEDANKKFLRVFEYDVKGSTGSTSSIQNVAFVSSDNTRSTNEVNTAYGVSTSSGYNSQREGSFLYTDELMYSFFANQSSGLKLNHEDLEQLDQFDLEEMDLKWQLSLTRTKLSALISMVTIDGEGVDWTGHAKDDTEDYALMAFNSSNLGSDTEIAKVKGMHAVPSPMTEIYMPPKSDFRTDDSKFTYSLKQSKNGESDAKTSDLASCESNYSVETLESMPKPVESKPKAVSKPKVWSDAPMIEEYESESNDEYVFKATVEQEIPSCASINTVKHVKSPRFPVNAARQKFSSQAASTSTVRKVNTARQTVNAIRPKDNLFKSHTLIRRPFNRTTAPKAHFTNHKVNNDRDKKLVLLGAIRKLLLRPQQAVIGDPIDITGTKSPNTIVDQNLENVLILKIH
uniref:Ribonuclease H-like domain-containing protein n=1 Tax=Tanacetum cinerariifolium TaxID=118510 RepID=A0A699H5F8_TANCI|nr:ribonuclease H-like domain-containing protein [Tanacetum cinerariifolium]